MILINVHNIFTYVPLLMEILNAVTQGIKHDKKVEKTKANFIKNISITIQYVLLSTVPGLLLNILEISF